MGLFLFQRAGHHLQVPLRPQQRVKGSHDGKREILFSTAHVNRRTLGLDLGQAQCGTNLTGSVERLLDAEAVIEQVDTHRNQRLAQFLGEVVQTRSIQQAGVAQAGGETCQVDLRHRLCANFADLSPQLVFRRPGFFDVRIAFHGYLHSFRQRQGGLLLLRCGSLEEHTGDDYRDAYKLHRIKG